MYYRLKKINLGSVAIYSFLLIFVLGFLIMLPIGMINMFIANFSPLETMHRHFIFPFGAIFYLFFPFVYAVIGTIINVILALIYNLFSLPLGGIRIQLDKVEHLQDYEV